MLLVVAVIVILIGMLLPLMSKSKTATRLVICTVNQRNLGQGAIAYSVNSQGKLFPYDNAAGLKYETFWMTLIDVYIGDMDQMRMCPETVLSQALQNSPQGVGWGTAKAAWGHPWSPGGFIGANYGSYGWNSWMHSGRTDIANSATPNSAEQRKYWKNVRACRTPMMTPFFSDMHWVDTWFQNNPNGAFDVPPDNLLHRNTASGRVCINRHDRSIGHGFVDGSGGTTSLEGLWGLTWNTESQPMNPPWAIPPQ